MGKRKKSGPNRSYNTYDLPVILACIVAVVLNLIALKSGYVFYSLLSITPFLFILVDVIARRKRTDKEKSNDNMPKDFYMFLAGLTVAVLLLMKLRTENEVLLYLSIIPCMYVMIAVLSRFVK